MWDNVLQEKEEIFNLLIDDPSFRIKNDDDFYTVLSVLEDVEDLSAFMSVCIRNEWYNYASIINAKLKSL